LVFKGYLVIQDGSLIPRSLCYVRKAVTAECNEVSKTLFFQFFFLEYQCDHTTYTKNSTDLEDK